VFQFPLIACTHCDLQCTEYNTLAAVWFLLLFPPPRDSCSQTCPTCRTESTPPSVISKLCYETFAMDDKHADEEPRFLSFPHLPDNEPALNKYSNTITREHDFPGAQVDGAQPIFNMKLTPRRPCSTLPECQTSRP
jgi:hypothetical protein